MTDTLGPMRLTETDLLAAAGDTVFGRGEDYVQYVRGLRVRGSNATATIQARRVYEVELDWSGEDLAANCTCPHFAEGWFCKHLVAVGLAAIDETAPAEPEVADHVDAWLEGLDAKELRDLVRELAARAPAAERLLEVRASAGGPDAEDAAKALASSVSDALRVRGFVDYRRSFEVARDAQAVLDELEQHLDAGAVDAVRPALLRALTRLRTITQHADDSSGSIGDACQRAADLHARSCREGRPDGRKLARWLAKFRDETPGWPQTPLSAYAAALDDKAMDTYRKAVAALDEKYAGVDHWKRFEVDQMLLEVADHDGDVDRAIELLTAGKRQEYGAVIDRLRDAGRDDEVLGWIDRAVEEGRVSSRLGPQGRDYWLDPAEVAEAYLAADRPDDGITVLRGAFNSQPGAGALAVLLTYARRLDREATERAWAIDEATRRATERFGDGAALVEIALADKNLDAAWEWAEEYGPGRMWEALAKASESFAPRQAADLHREKVDAMLVQANSKVYGQAAKALVKIRTLYERAGDAGDFAAYLQGLREQYARRPSLMAALDRAGL